MPKVAYSDSEREQIREALITTGLELMAEQGIQHTTVEQIYKRVGISRTFFYSFFPAKEDLVVQVFFRQQPKIIQHMQASMRDPNSGWRDVAKHFLYACCYTRPSRIAVMTMEEQQAIFKHLSAENYKLCQERQLKFFAEALGIFGIQANMETAKLFCNLVLSVAIVCKAIPDTLPFLFAESASQMVDLQINAIVDYMEKLRAQDTSDKASEQNPHMGKDGMREMTK